MKYSKIGWNYRNPYKLLKTGIVMFGANGKTATAFPSLFTSNVSTIWTKLYQPLSYLH